MSNETPAEEASTPGDRGPRHRRGVSLSKTWAAVMKERPSAGLADIQAIGKQVATIAAAAGANRAVLDLGVLAGPVINPSVFLGSGVADGLLEQNRSLTAFVASQAAPHSVAQAASMLETYQPTAVMDALAVSGGRFSRLTDVPGAVSANLVAQQIEQTMRAVGGVAGPNFISQQISLLGAFAGPVAGIDVPALLRMSVPGLNTMQEHLQDLLRTWRADVSIGVGLAALAGFSGLHAALAARRAALLGRWDDVQDFLRDWLGIRRPTQAHAMAAAEVLLEHDRDALRGEWGNQDEDALLRHLRTRTMQVTRGHRPIRETRIHGQRVLMLDRPTTVEGAVTLLDLVAAKPVAPEPTEDGYEDERLRRAFGLMTDEERAIAEVFAVTEGISWEAAAVAAGSPPEAGTRFQRKRLRIRDEVLQRLSARK